MDAVIDFLFDAPLGKKLLVSAVVVMVAGILGSCAAIGIILYQEHSAYNEPQPVIPTWEKPALGSRVTT